MNIQTVCLVIGLAIRAMKWFDKDGKLASLLELLQAVDAQLCGSTPFGASEAPQVDAETQSLADEVAGWLKAKCDCDDCECD